jgi:DNA repair exonuclease SbcCD ATPase subunit
MEEKLKALAQAADQELKSIRAEMSSHLEKGAGAHEDLLGRVRNVEELHLSATQEIETLQQGLSRVNDLANPTSLISRIEKLESLAEKIAALDPRLSAVETGLAALEQNLSELKALTDRVQALEDAPAAAPAKSTSKKS